MSTWIDLSGRAKFRLSGPDRVRYLNGQVTNNVARLRPGEAMPALVCTAKGRLEGEVVVRVEMDCFLVDAPGELRDSLMGRLEKYLIADECAWEDVTDEFSLWHELESSNAATVQRVGPPGHDHWLPAGSPPPAGTHLDPATVDLLRLRHGVPVWGAELTPETLPQEAGLEATAVDFHKGCYVGQEVVSRLRSVGHVNRRLCRLETTADVALAAGDAIFAAPPHPDAAPVAIGRVTSARRDPERAIVVALGYVKRSALATDSGFFAPSGLLKIFKDA